MALSGGRTAETQWVRSQKIDLWSQLNVDVEPSKARVIQHGADGMTGIDSRVRVRHDGRTWWLGVDGDERAAELIDGPRPVPDWIGDVARYLGVREVDV